MAYFKGFRKSERNKRKLTIAVCITMLSRISDKGRNRC